MMIFFLALFVDPYVNVSLLPSLKDENEVDDTAVTASATTAEISSFTLSTLVADIVVILR